MGDKNLKAIVVHGTKDITIAKPSEFREVGNYVLGKTDRIKKYWEDWTHETGKWLLEDGVYGCLDTHLPFENPVEWLEGYVEKLKAGVTACYNCEIGCKSVISLPDGSYSYIKCGSWFAFMLACKIRDLTFSLKCYHLCEIYGLDVVSTAHLLAFAITLYEKGILTKEDTGGMHLEWGNEDVAFSLIRKMVRREDIGDLLANGVYEAARRIGRGAEEHARHLKKLEPIPYQMYKPYSALRSSITDKPDATRSETFIVQEGLAESREWKEDCVRSDFFSFPKELEEIFFDDYVGLERDYEKIVPFLSYDMDKFSLADCSGVCIFWTGFWRYNPVSPADHLKLISHAAGIDVDEDKAMMIAKRTLALMRAYNVLTGIRRKDDAVPEKYFREPPRPPFFLLERDKFDKMISEYYKLRGWNDDGIPSGEELDRLDLQFVRKDLEKRGIL
jgi:aldehyde:ferredoxin oxidoreductase